MLKSLNLLLVICSGLLAHLLWAPEAAIAAPALSGQLMPIKSKCAGANRSETTAGRLESSLVQGDMTVITLNTALPDQPPQYRNLRLPAADSVQLAPFLGQQVRVNQVICYPLIATPDAPETPPIRRSEPPIPQKW
jgi:hypothetical protein